MEETTDKVTLKVLRERAGLTQQELARITGTAVSSIGFWEAGKKDPSFKNVLAIARALNVSLKALAIAQGLDVTGIPDDEAND